MGSFLLQSFWGKKLEVNFSHFYIGSLNILVISRFRVVQNLCFKARLSAKPLISKCFFYSYANKTPFHNKGFARSRVLNGGVFETRNWFI